MAWYNGRIARGIISFFRPSPRELGREPWPTEEGEEEQEEEPPSAPEEPEAYPYPDEYGFPEELEEDPYSYRDTQGIVLYNNFDEPVGPYTWQQWRTIVYQDYAYVFASFNFSLESISIMKQLTARGLWTEEDWREWREWYDAVAGV